MEDGVERMRALLDVFVDLKLACRLMFTFCTHVEARGLAFGWHILGF
jgi:hypothetical protein